MIIEMSSTMIQVPRIKMVISSFCSRRDKKKLQTVVKYCKNYAFFSLVNSNPIDYINFKFFYTSLSVLPSLLSTAVSFIKRLGSGSRGCFSQGGVQRGSKSRLRGLLFLLSTQVCNVFGGLGKKSESE